MSLVTRVEPSVEVMVRADLPFLFNERGLSTIGIEIGVDRGIFAKEILTHWKGRELYCCDPWTTYNEMPWERDGDLLLAAINLAPFGDRVRLVRCPGSVLNGEFRRVIRPLCFVYIDGDHSYEAASEDIHMWWDLLMPHGILCGHDFSDEHPPVRRAVMEFAVKNDRTVYYTPSGDEPGSWYLYKTAPSSMLNVRNRSKEGL